MSEEKSLVSSMAKVGGFVELTTVEIAEQTGKHHKHVKRDTENMLVVLYGLDSLPKFGQSYTADNGQTYTCYKLPKNDVLTLVSGYSIPLRAKIIRRLDELENKQPATPVLPQNFLEALKLLVVTTEEKQKLERQNRTLINANNELNATKAQIGSRREATSMQSAGAKQKVIKRLTKEKEIIEKEKEDLKVKVGEATSHATIVAVQKHIKNVEFKWKPLKSYCTTNNLNIIKVFDAHYGDVNSYPAEAWKAAYDVDIQKLLCNRLGVK